MPVDKDVYPEPPSRTPVRENKSGLPDFSLFVKNFYTYAVDWPVTSFHGEETCVCAGGRGTTRPSVQCPVTGPYPGTTSPSITAMAPPGVVAPPGQCFGVPGHRCRGGQAEEVMGSQVAAVVGSWLVIVLASWPIAVVARRVPRCGVLSRSCAVGVVAPWLVIA